MLLSWAGLGCHTAYVDAWDNLGYASGAVSPGYFCYDTSTPSASVSIDGGAAYTNSTTASLGVSASNPLAGDPITNMRFSTDGVSYGAWTTYSSSASVTLPAGDGAKHVYVEVENAAGTISPAAADTIVLDQTPPTVTRAPTPSIRLVSLSPAGAGITMAWTATDATSGVFQAIAFGSTALRVAIVGVLAAALVTVGNAGGVGSTVAGVARVPFVVGIDRYLPAAFGKIHPRWKTPYISILVQAGISGVILLLSQISETANNAYQILVDAAIILYFIPFVYMYAAAIKLSYRKDRAENKEAVLIPGGKFGVWVAGGLGLIVVVVGIALSFIPPGDTANKFVFEMKLVGGTVAAVALGLGLYIRGARQKAREMRRAT